MIDFIKENNNVIASGASPSVAILMGGINRARILPDQLDSIQPQTHRNCYLTSSDDRSSDDIVAILKAYKAKWSFAKLIGKEGVKQDFSVNFLRLVCNPEPLVNNYAFCDQDDVWLTTKLAIAIQNISENQEENIPYFYFGRTSFVYEKLRKI